MRAFSNNSRNKLKGVHPLLVKALESALQTSPYDFAIVQGVRTKAEQRALYAQGRDILADVNALRKNVGWAAITQEENKVVTWTLNSNHIEKPDGYGHAIDFAAYVNGSISWDERYYAPIADAIIEAGKAVGVILESGAYWDKKDWGHIEVKQR